VKRGASTTYIAKRQSSFSSGTDLGGFLCFSDPDEPGYLSVFDRPGASPALVHRAIAPIPERRTTGTMRSSTPNSDSESESLAIEPESRLSFRAVSGLPDGRRPREGPRDESTRAPPPPRPHLENKLEEVTWPISLPSTPRQQRRFQKQIDRRDRQSVLPASTRHHRAVDIVTCHARASIAYLGQ